MPKTSAETTRDNVLKYKRHGLTQIKVWVHPEEAHAARLHIAKQPKTKAILTCMKGGTCES